VLLDIRGVSGAECKAQTVENAHAGDINAVSFAETSEYCLLTGSSDKVFTPLNIHFTKCDIVYQYDLNYFMI
jgi:hypothetical protein